MEQMRLEIVETTRNVKVFSLFVSVVYLCTTVKSTEPRWSGRDGPDLLQWFAVRVQLMANGLLRGFALGLQDRLS